MIAACANNFVIGTKGRIPWKAPRDWEHFLSTTAGHALIVGRRSYEGEGALPGRHTVVVSSTLSPHKIQNAYLERTLAAAIETASTLSTTVWVGGGEGIFREALPLVESLHLTRINGEVSCLAALLQRHTLTKSTALPAEIEGDAFFPASWRENLPVTVLSVRTTAAECPVLTKRIVCATRCFCLRSMTQTSTTRTHSRF